jgi:hypothetical protein
MRATRFAIASIALVALHGCRSPASPSAESVTFRFAPPDGTTLVQQLTTTRSTSSEGFARRNLHTVTKSSLEFRKRADGYVVGATLLSSETMHDGRITLDAAYEALRDVPISYRVRGDGTLEGIDGLAGLAQKASATASPESAQALAETLREDVLVEHETAEWNERIGELSGRTVSIGESIDGEESFTLPSGEPIALRTRTTFRRFERCGRTRCVRIERQFGSNEDALAGKVGPAEATPRVSGSLRRLTDPQTMLVYAEDLSRSVEAEVKGPDDSLVRVSIRETRRYAFEYR